MSLALVARFVLGSNLGQIGIAFRAFLYPGVPFWDLVQLSIYPRSLVLTDCDL